MTMPLSENSHVMPTESVALVRLASVIVTLIGVIGLIGCIFGIPLLRTMLPGLLPMVPNAATLLILVGLALAHSSVRESTRRGRSIARAISLFVTAIGVLTLCEYALKQNFGIDQILMVASPSTQIELLYPGRLAPASAICFILVGLSLLLLPSRSSMLRVLVQVMTLAALAMASLALIGYAYGIKELYRVEPLVAMSLPGAIAMCVACSGILYTRDDFQIMLPIRSQRLGGAVARMLFPAVLGLPLILGWVQLKGEQLGLFEIEVGMVVYALSTILGFSVLVWYCANTLNRADEQRDLARQAEDEYRALSNLDPLTNLLNRRRFWEGLDAEWTRAERYDRPLSCIMADIDFFKQVNDTYGHSTGDAVLKLVAALFLEQCRPSDFVCRYGGEEFCVVLPETDETEAAQLAERLRTMLAAAPLGLPDATVLVTGSFGVAQCLLGTEQVHAFVNRADQALLVAKRTGRNQVFRASMIRSAAPQVLEPVLL